MEQLIPVGAPYFDDLKVGDVFDEAPAVTLTEGHAAAYQSAFGDRLKLPLDHRLSATVTRRDTPVVHPLLVCHLSIGQTTGVSQRVRGNLFYRGLVLHKVVHTGDTLHTRAEVVALKQNSLRPDRPATGLVGLRIKTVDQTGDAVLDYFRCPMLPLRDRDAIVARAGDLDAIAATVDPSEIARAVPSGWALGEFPARAAALRTGATYVIEARDTVTSALEIAHLTLNTAFAHADPAASPYGQRLVYGGHTISVAFAQLTRAFPDLITLLAWHRCDHTGPVFEGDVLRTEVTVHRIEPARDGANIVELSASTYAQTPGSDERAVLDWRFAALCAEDVR